IERGDATLLVGRAFVQLAPALAVELLQADLDTRRRQAVLQVEDVHAQRVAGGQNEGGQAAQGGTEQQVFQHLHGGSPVQSLVGRTWAMACSAQPSSNCAPPAPATPMAPI